MINIINSLNIRLINMSEKEKLINNVKEDWDIIIKCETIALFEINFKLKQMFLSYFGMWG